MGLIALAVGILALAGTAFWAAHNARPLVTQRLAAAFASRELGPVSFHLEQIGFSRIEIVDLEMGDPPDLVLPKVTLSYSLLGLLAGRIDEVEVHGLRVSGHLGAAGLRLGQQPDRPGPAVATPFPPPPSKPGSQPWPELPIDRLEIEEAHFDFKWGDVALRGRLWLSLDDGRQLAFRIETDAFRVEGPSGNIDVPAAALDGEAVLDPAERSLRLLPSEVVVRGPAPDALEVAIHLPALTASQSGPLDAPIDFKASGGQLVFADPPITLVGIGAKGRFTPSLGALEAQIEIEALTSGAGWFPPLAGRGSVSRNGNDLRAELSLEDTDRWLALRLEASQNLGTRRGRARLDALPLVLGPGHSLLDLVPALAEAGIEASGEVALRARARWSPGAIVSSAEVDLIDLSLARGPVRASCLQGELHFQGLPWRTAGPQTLTLQGLDAGLPLHNGRIEFEWHQSRGAERLDARFDLAGGQIAARGRFGDGATGEGLMIEANQLRLADLLALLPIEGLSGDGVLEGSLPLRFADGALVIQNGALGDEAGGWLRYRPAEGEGTLSDFGISELIDLEAALADFHYRRLHLGLDGDLGGEITVRATLDGANPAYRDGQPYVFNLEIVGRLVDLVDRTARFYTLPAQIEEQLHAKGERPAARATPFPACEHGLPVFGPADADPLLDAPPQGQ